MPAILRRLAGLPAGARILDAGCGNGYISRRLSDAGWAVTGIDVSESGIRAARAGCSTGRFEVASACDPRLPFLLVQRFDAIVSLELIEHLYSPVAFLSNCEALLRVRGRLLISTPYHGYVKDVLLALTGRLERHRQPATEGGHIKFWSRPTLETVLRAQRFCPTSFDGCGRLPLLWKSMLVTSERQPAAREGHRQP
jgi:2-polyprenyl-6-hydroxyphenyl methylase/3-demethylubiquinone-9 3-methyltransferase